MRTICNRHHPGRARIEVSHTCLRTCGQIHQTRLLLPVVTLDGVRLVFLVGCHCLASAGRFRSGRSRSEGRFPSQNGHPALLVEQELTTAVHLWVLFRRHIHAATWPLPAATSSGILAFAGSHSAAKTGLLSATLLEAFTFF